MARKITLCGWHTGAHNCKNLMERERAVLALMIEGLNNREIADRLIISSSTVKNHGSSILAKLGTTSRTHTVARALENNILA